MPATSRRRALLALTLGLALLAGWLAFQAIRVAPAEGVAAGGGPSRAGAAWIEPRRDEPAADSAPASERTALPDAPERPPEPRAYEPRPPREGLCVRVLRDDTGRPLPFTAIELTLPEAKPRIAAFTDRAGEAWLKLPEGCKQAWVGTRGTGLCALRHPRLVDGRAQEVELRLRPRWVLEGQVKGPAGGYLTDARVRLAVQPLPATAVEAAPPQPATPGRHRAHHTPEPATVKVEELGRTERGSFRFVLDDSQPDGTWLTIAHQDALPVALRLETLPWVNGHAYLVQQLEAGNALRGTLLDTEGQPVSGCALHAFEPACLEGFAIAAPSPLEELGASSRATTTSADGGFVLRPWPRGRATRIRLAAGECGLLRAATSTSARALDAETLAIEPAAPLPLRLSVERFPTVQVTVHGQVLGVKDDRLEQVRVGFDLGPTSDLLPSEQGVAAGRPVEREDQGFVLRARLRARPTPVMIWVRATAWHTDTQGPFSLAGDTELWLVPTEVPPPPSDAEMWRLLEQGELRPR